MAEERFTPDESWGQPQEQAPPQQIFTQDDVADWGEPTPLEAESAVGSAARGFAHEAIPAAVGGLVGLGAGALTAPFLGGIPGGLAAGAGASYATRKFEDWLLEKLGFNDEAQQQANRAAHPVATAAGELSTALIPFGVGSKLQIGQRLLGSGIQAGVETGSEAAQGEGFDPVQIAFAGGIGAIANKPRSGTMAALSRVPGMKARMGGMEAKPTEEGLPTSAPDPSEAPTRDPTRAEVEENIKQYANDPIMGPHWRDYAAKMEQAPDKGDAGLAQEASQGKGPEFTPAQADAANDTTTVAAGVAHENPKPPQDPAIGSGTMAAKPHDPTRDYRKDKPEAPPPSNDNTVTPGENVTTGQIAPDVAAALKRDKPQTTFEQQTVQPPNQPQLTMDRAALSDQVQPTPPVAPPSMEQINQRMASIPGMQTRTNGLSAKSAQPIEQIGRGPVTAPVTQRGKKTFVPKRPTPEEAAAHLEKMKQAPPGEVVPSSVARKGLDEYSPEDLARALRENPAEFKKALEADPQGVRAVFARNKPLMEQVIAEHPGLAHILRPMKKAIREKEKYDAGDKRLGKRGEKYETVRASVKEAVDEAVPHWAAKDDPEGKFDPDHVKAIAKRVWENLTKNRPPKFNPFKGEQGYKPQKMYQMDNMHFGVATAAKDVLEAPVKTSDPNIQNQEQAIQTFDSWLRAYFNKDEGAAEALQAQRKGAAAQVKDTELRAPLDEANLADVIDEGAREPIPLLERGKKVLAHNELREYVNGLSDEEYSRLKNYDDELEKTVVGTKNPDTVKQAYQRYLAPEVEPKPVTSAVAGERTYQGRRILDPVGEAPPPQVAGFDAVSPEETKGVRTPVKTAADLPRTEDTKPVIEKFKDFLTDDKGSVRIPAFLQNIGNNLFSRKPLPASHPVSDLLAEAFRGDFHGMDSRITQAQAELHAHLGAAPQKSNTFWRGLFNAYESKQPLNAEQQQVWDQWVQPLQDRYNKVMDAWRAIDPDIPAKFAGVEANHIPRLLLKSLARQKYNDTPWLRSLNDWNPATQDRTYFVLTDGKGTRVLVEKTENGDWHTLGPQGGHGVNFTSSLAPSWKGHPGDTVSFNYGGQPRAFTLEHAKVNEITKAIPGMEYVKHPLLVYASAIHSAEAALLKNKLFNSVKNNPDYQNAITTKKDVARDRGYQLRPTQLEAFAKDDHGHTIYMPDSLRYVMDDMAKPGFENEGLNKLSQFAAGAARPLYFMSPIFHPLNVADNWVHAMGGTILSGKLPFKGKEVADAWKSVFTQDHWQKRWREAGGRTMYTTALFDGGFMHDAAKKFAIDLPKLKSFWDPIKHATNIDVPELGRMLMNKSNKITWAANDMMQTALFQARIREGLSDVAARQSVERMIGAYRVDSSTFAGSRIGQKLLNTPAFAWFSFYHQDLWRSVGKTIAGLMPSADTQARKEALGNLMMSGLLMFAAYPLLDKGAQAITGNKEAEFGRRGLSTLQDAAYHGFVKGDRSVGKLAQNVWTPSIPANMAIEGAKNKDFTGRDIWSPGLSTGHNVGRVADWGLKQVLPPYSQAAPAFRPGTNPLTEIPKRMAEASIGIKDPSPQAIKYEHNAPKRARAEYKKAYKRPGGLFEYLWTHK